MGVSVSIGYEGATWEEDRKIEQCDMRCPLLSTTKANNFWKSICAQKIGNKDIKTCYGGCKVAKSIPEVKAIIDKLDIITNADQFVNNVQRKRYQDVEGMVMVSMCERQTIISDMLNKVLVKNTMKNLQRGRTIIGFYRKLYREGLMSAKGEMLNDKKPTNK
jgi:hypothetical protein